MVGEADFDSFSGTESKRTPRAGDRACIARSGPCWHRARGRGAERQRQGEFTRAHFAGEDSIAKPERRYIDSLQDIGKEFI